ncbi:MAG: thioredoxin domain-containing protein [Acidimicrobiales bacterium]
MTAPENRLSREASPYLRQHRFDPVDWYPWGDEALQRARELDRPLFVSIGYSACHWCHVMAHESFSDEVTAAQMNETVVAVKVDREERPDVDAVYMEAVLAANGHGGWPMSVFATPDGRPFFTGTYFPSSPRHNMPAFGQVLSAIADVWTHRREDVEAQADSLAAALAERMRPPERLITFDGSDETHMSLEVVREAIRQACTRLASIADTDHGGFGDAPKFPQPLLLDLLLRAEVAGIRPHHGRAPLEIVLETLEAMDSGGIYDQIGGGFSRYSVDRTWLVPHFEKMLYDQVLLARVHLHAWQLTGDRRWRQVLDETLSYVLGRLAQPSGGLGSAEDADSEGEEGRYYLWSAAELVETVGPELARASVSWYGVTHAGNFEGRNILVRSERGDLLRPPEIELARERLASRRAERVPPGLDDKVLTEWNAMACSVLAECAGATGEERYQVAAEQIARVLVDARNDNAGRTPRSIRSDGVTPTPGFAGDVAWLLDALVRLFELSGRSSYLVAACDMAAELVEQFVDPATGAVFTSRAEARGLVVRPTELHDGVIPSAASVAAIGLSRLAVLIGDEKLGAVATSLVEARGEAITTAPTTVPELLGAAELVSGGFIEVASTGSGRTLLGEVRQRFVPTAVYAWLSDDAGEPRMGLPLLEDRFADAVYICQGGTCRLPARDPDQVKAELDHVLHTYASGAPR